MGAGSGNTSTQVMAAILKKMGVETGADYYALMEAGEKYVRPLITHSLEVTNESLILGYPRDLLQALPSRS